MSEPAEQQDAKQLAARQPRGCVECSEPFGFHLPFCGLRQGDLRPQPSPWSCLPSAFAMVMNKEPAEIIKLLGRDDARGFHQLELVWFAYSLGFRFLPFEVGAVLEGTACLMCMQRQADGTLIHDGREGCACGDTGIAAQPPLMLPKLEELLLRHDGVLVGRVNGNDHAACWRHVPQRVYDPNYTIYGIEKFEVEIFWALT